MIDLGDDLHAGRERQVVALRVFQGLLAQLYSGLVGRGTCRLAVAVGCAVAGGACIGGGSVGFSRVRADMNDLAGQHAVLLEWICSEFYLRGLADLHKTHIFILDIDVGEQLLPLGHQRQHYPPWLHYRADRGGGEILDHAILRRSQFHQAFLV